MSRTVTLTPDELAEARRLQAGGMSIVRIAIAMSLPEHRVRCALNPEYAAKYGTTRERRKQAAIVSLQYHAVDPRIRRDAVKLYRQVPADTRSLTAQLAGDPLPGRSALDRDRSVSP